MKLRSFGESRTSPVRIIILVVLFVLVLVAFVGRLLSLQVANSEYYKERALPKNQVTLLVEASRGEIVDRNGAKLVINKGVSCIRLNRSLLPRGRENEIILELIRFFDKNGVVLEDKMPAELTAPYRFVPPQDSVSNSMLKIFLRNTKFDEQELYGTGLYEKLYERYNIDGTVAKDANKNEIRRLIGIRYALEGSDFSRDYPYTVLENASVEIVSMLSERSHLLPGVEVFVENSRYYPGGSLASHILGRTGPIYAEEVEKYTSMGYALDETVGKDGAEYAFEQYLRGVDGYKIIEYSSDGEDIIDEKLSENHPPEYGKTVTLTISSGMQAAAEKALKDTIDSINLENIRNGNPTRASGAVVVTDCNSGALYASASYPTYDQNTYRETISEMLTDKRQPLLNRATNGRYPPGSTFKIATAIAALSEGIIDENTRIYDSGIYKEYKDYQPHCWSFDKYGYPHGWQNVVDAIKNSCNYYFFEVGRLLGTESLNSYAKRLGLGEKTGIEISEDQGILAGPEYRASVGKTWVPGDLIQSAIGQSDNLFTPVQLASFLSTVVNGGTRYEVHLLKSVNDFATGDILEEKQPKILDKIEISDHDLELVKRGMKSVVEDGTAASVFVGYPHSIGGKTGTAQRGFGTDNAIFAGFAPYEEPEIVVSVVIEAGEHSYTATRVAKGVFDYYFENIEEFAE